MNASVQSNGQGRQDNVWIVALAVLCLGILGYGYFFSTNTNSNRAYLAGYYLAGALPIWGLFYAIYGRARGVQMNAVAFVAIFGALFFSGLIGVSRQEQQVVKAVSGMQEDLARVEKASVTSSGVPARIESAPISAPKASGEFGEVERWFKEFMVRQVALRNDYLLELEAIGWNSILDVQRLQTDTTLSESKAIIERAKVVVDKYDRKTAAFLLDTRARINALSMSEEGKQAMRGGFDKSINDGITLKEMSAQEREVVRQVENLITLLSISEGWVVEGGKIRFRSERERALANSYMQEVQRIARAQEQMQKNNSAEVDQRLEALKQLAAR